MENFYESHLKQIIIGVIVGVIVAYVTYKYIIPAFSDKNDVAKNAWVKEDRMTSNSNSILEYRDGHFVGNGFTVTLPSNFIVTPSINPTAPGDAQSYFFTSPDGQVEFYIYKSHWGGEANDIVIDPDKEEYISSPKIGHGGEIVRYDIQARDSTYKRAYLETQSQEENIHLVKGIKYRSQAAYNTYYPSFRYFFKSTR